MLTSGGGLGCIPVFVLLNTIKRRCASSTMIRNAKSSSLPLHSLMESTPSPSWTAFLSDSPPPSTSYCKRKAERAAKLGVLRAVLFWYNQPLSSPRRSNCNCKVRVLVSRSLPISHEALASDPTGTTASATSKKKSKRKPKKATPPMDPPKALILNETWCYTAAINRHYANPPLETTTLDCITARRPLPCSLCASRAKRTLVFTAPASSSRLPPIVASRSSIPRKVSVPRKLKLTRKEKELVSVNLISYRDKLRVNEQLGGRFRNMPPTLFLPSTLQNILLDKLLSIKSISDLEPLLQHWYHRSEHTQSLYVNLVLFRNEIQENRDIDRLSKNSKSRETRKATRKRKRGQKATDDETDDDFSANPTTTLPSRKSTRPRKRPAIIDEGSEDENSSESSVSSDIPSKPIARPRRPLNSLTNAPSRPKALIPTAADVAKDYRPQYRPRQRGAVGS